MAIAPQVPAMRPSPMSKVGFLGELEKPQLWQAVQLLADFS